jgi:hypothetical protein
MTEHCDTPEQLAAAYDISGTLNMLELQREIGMAKTFGSLAYQQQLETGHGGMA